MKGYKQFKDKEKEALMPYFLLTKNKERKDFVQSFLNKFPKRSMQSVKNKLGTLRSQMKKTEQPKGQMAIPFGKTTTSMPFISIPKGQPHQTIKLDQLESLLFKDGELRITFK